VGGVLGGRAHLDLRSGNISRSTMAMEPKNVSSEYLRERVARHYFAVRCGKE